MKVLIKRIFLLSLFIISTCPKSSAQTQEDFQSKYNDIFLQQDKKKALAQSKELYNVVEKKKELQTYSNYYLLKYLFENTTPDTALAKTCGDKADKIIREAVGLETACP